MRRSGSGEQCVVPKQRKGGLRRRKKRLRGRHEEVSRLRLPEPRQADYLLQVWGESVCAAANAAAADHITPGHDPDQPVADCSEAQSCDLVASSLCGLEAAPYRLDYLCGDNHAPFGFGNWLLLTWLHKSISHAAWTATLPLRYRRSVPRCLSVLRLVILSDLCPSAKPMNVCAYTLCSTDTQADSAEVQLDVIRRLCFGVQTLPKHSRGRADASEGLLHRSRSGRDRRAVPKHRRSSQGLPTASLRL